MPHKSKKPNVPNQFTHDSKRFCDICGIDVHIGVGGETNWKYHIDNTSHSQTATSKASTRPISSFFSKRSKDDVVPGPRNPTRNIASSDTVLTVTREENSIINLVDDDTPPQSIDVTSLPFHICEDGCNCKSNSTNSCPGYKLILPSRDHSPFTSYPFLIHMRRDLPWDVFIQRDKLILRSHSCSGSRSVFKRNSAGSCISCQQIHDHNIISGLRFRLIDGSKKSTPWAYLTIAEMYAALKRKTAQINELKMRSLNWAQKVDVRNRQIEQSKRLIIAIGTENIPRIRQIIGRGCREGRSVSSMLEDVDRAARGMYRPRGYELADYQRSFLIYSLGGRFAAAIAQRAFGLPCINTTKKHVIANPLCPSAKFPTDAEMLSNIRSMYPKEQSRYISGTAPIIGVVVQVDELNLQERMRWNPRDNTIQGICQEHGNKCSLEFNSEYQADIVLKYLKDKTIHLATEATVIAFSLISTNPSEYAPRPFVISGTCKRETVKEQKRLLLSSATALKSGLGADMRIYCITSDGDSHCRGALAQLTLDRELSQESDLYSILSPLPLFNCLCGPDDLTCDFDTRHVLKRFRNTNPRQRGVIVDGVLINIEVLHAHLLSLGNITSSEINSILKPNDKQDVVLMIKLLHAISCLPECDEKASPTVVSTRRVFRLLGKVYFFLLQLYLNIELCLNEQLTYLSAAVHLILALYHQNKGDFIPVQLYFDVQSMIKNVYFTAGKMKLDNPDGKFSILTLGTDGLEKVFGKIRTMVGSDTNIDQLQLANRIDAAVQCINILEEHPDWGGKSRRLDLKPLSSDLETVKSGYDHVSPRTWKGNIDIKNVILESCWKEGRRLAEDALREARVPVPFNEMEDAGGFDMLRPFGEGKVIQCLGTP